MTFNSVAFGIFFFIVVFLCRALPTWRVLILLLASFVFYSWLSWRFGIVLFVMSVVGYVAPFVMAEVSTLRLRKLALAVSIMLILLPLFILKYWNFVAGIVEQAAATAGITFVLLHNRYPLPPGISFHSFQLLAYVIDAFKKRIPTEQRLGIFFLFSSFFPQLVAGPIERPAHLIPQLDRAGTVEPQNVNAAFQLFLYGLFLKVVIADVVAIKVDQIYNSPLESHGGAVLLAATALFYIQIYCDFAGYSLMAIGVARAIGVRLVRNFNQPMIAASLHDFWHRWHISLSQWFRDYVYIPLGGSREGFPRQVLAIMAAFVLSGLWHGANWTFLIWGGLHGAALVLSLLIVRTIPEPIKRLPFMIVLAWLGTQLFVIVSWVFFRARTTEQAFGILSTIAHDFLVDGKGWVDLVALPHLLEIPAFLLVLGLVGGIWVLVLDRQLGRGDESEFPSSMGWPMGQLIMILAIAYAAAFAPPTAGAPFIYFQF